MGANFDRLRNEAMAREGPSRVGCDAAFTAIAVAFAWWFGSWFAIPVALVLLLRLLAEADSWLSSRRELRNPGTAARHPRPPPEAIWDDPDFGRLEWSPDDWWNLIIEVDGDEVEVSLNGTRETGPDPESKALWIRIRDTVPQVWTEVVAFVRAWAATSKTYFDRDEFRLDGIMIDPSHPHQEDVTFHFKIATDPNGSYMVPIRDGKPQHVHRDS